MNIIEYEIFKKNVINIIKKFVYFIGSIILGQLEFMFYLVKYIRGDEDV